MKISSSTILVDQKTGEINHLFKCCSSIYCPYSFIKDGKLFIRPTLTAERFGEEFLHNGKYNLKKEGCNLAIEGGCVLYVNDGLNYYDSSCWFANIMIFDSANRILT